MRYAFSPGRIIQNELCLLLRDVQIKCDYKPKEYLCGLNFQDKTISWDYVGLFSAPTITTRIF